MIITPLPQGRIQDFILGGTHFPLLSVGDSRARRARDRGAKPRALRLGGLGERLSSSSGIRGFGAEPRPPTIFGHSKQNISLKNENLKAK